MDRAVGDQRRLARVILASIVGLLAAFVLFASGPIGGVSFAQQQSPSPGPVTIEFINPSGTGHSEEVSAKSDRSGGSSDGAYHLVAWVNQLPADPRVEFSYNDPNQNGRETAIGTATQGPIPDTFEFFWTPPSDHPDGSLTLHATLFSGAAEIDRDTESDLTLNNQTSMIPGSEAQGQTVEITRPVNGGVLGFFTPRDKDTNALVYVSFSDGTSNVQVTYSVSPPGSEPAWKNCGRESASAAADGIRCTLAAVDEPNEVTAVAAFAQDGDSDSGDAHRITFYDQVPTAMTLTPNVVNDVDTEECSAVITANLKDQEDIPIAAANIDVHAEGPSDLLSFDTAGASANQPPELNHGRESGVDCGDQPDPPANGIQGEHDSPTGNDRKHIESTTGTNDAGNWTFRLFSPSFGGTQITVWSDNDNDDVFCGTEASIDGAVGWGEPAPQPTGFDPDLATCPTPTATGPSPTPTETGTDPRGCTVIGTDESEQLDGTEGDDIICGLGGNDIIRGLGGDDTIFGDDGNDDILGGAGNDVIIGGADDDSGRGGAGDDGIRGGSNKDLLTGGAGNDSLRGNEGFDTVRGGDGLDSVSGGRRDDLLRGGRGHDRLFGGRGSDILTGGPDRDRCIGGPGRDEERSCEA